MNSPSHQQRSNQQLTHQPHTYRVDLHKESFVFSAAHFITFAGTICERLHGHNYGVRVSVEGTIDENQYVVDFIALRDAILAITRHWDHHVLLPSQHPLISVTREGDEVIARFEQRRWVFPAEDCIILPLVNTTAEELARVLGETLLSQIGNQFTHPISTIEIAVDENHGQWGVCRLPWPRN